MPLWSSNPNSGDPYAPLNDDESSQFDSILIASKPFLKKLTFSSFVGYCSAVTAKKIGKGVAFVAGLGFIALQGLAHSGFIDVNWKQVEKSVVAAVDTDNDGEITEKDLKRYLEKVKAILTNNIPDASGFGLGFMYGLKG
ncbi:hypothetical protein ACHAWF_018009 [Thalassiosira exigua]